MSTQLDGTKWLSLKRASVIVLVVFTFVFVYLLPSGMVDMAPTVVPVSAFQGFVNIPAVAAKDRISTDNAIYRLQGEWEYYPNALLSPEDFAGGVHPEPIYVSVPHSWNSDPVHFTDSSGFATYRLTGIKAGLDESFGVYSRFQFGAYKIFINGMEMIEVGNVTSNVDDYYISYRTGSALVRPADQSRFDIIIQIQNYDHVLAGFTGSVYCGEMSHVKYFTEFLMMLNGVMIGSLLLLFCYFLAVYLQNRSKELYLNFAIITLMSLYITMTTCNESITYRLVPTVSPHILFKLEYITQIIASFFATDYIVSRYIKDKTYRYISASICAAVIIFLTVVPSIIVSWVRMEFQIIGVSYFILPIFLSIRGIIKNRSVTAAWELISLLSILLGIIFSKLGIMIWGSVDLFPVLVTIYCFIQVVVMLLHYSDIEEDLRKLNQTLELRIEERTSELIESNKRAEAATAAKSDFLAQMSHEIRTPMNAIIGMSDLITTENLNESQKLYFNDLKEVSRSLLNIVNDILDFSKIESGKFRITPAHYHFFTMIDNLCSLTKYTARAKGLVFESEIDTSIPDVLYGDETRVRQVVSNILSNAVKYTTRGSVKLIVKNDISNHEILFSVADTGAGIKPEDMPRLFKLFERLDSDKNRSEMGTGLGLAICKQLTELMGGSVSVESEFGVGSLFTIKIPLVAGDPNKVEVLDISHQIYANRASVLVVDDNSINISVAKGIFATHNIVPDTALSGYEAIEMVKNKDYDIIFMDHMMPVMDGIETTAEIRKLGDKYTTIPIIALTANAVSGAKEYLMENGMNDFISKPIDRAGLNHLLSRWLPQDKIDSDSKLWEAHPENAGGDEFMTELSNVHDLDIMAGLRHAGGDTDTYKTILKQFARETPGYLSQLDEYLADGEFPSYTVVVHGIKGSLNAIGAEALGYWAYMLEMSSKEGEIDRCTTETEGFIRAVHSLIGKLTPSIGITDTMPSADKRTIDLNTFFEILTRLKNACLLGDCSVIDDIAADLSEINPGEHFTANIQEIISLSELMEYDEVITLIETLESTHMS